MAAFFGAQNAQRDFEEDDKKAKLKSFVNASPPKRISTPAGMRLSVIMENGVQQKTAPRRNSMGYGSWSKGSTLVNFPREERGGPIGYSYDIFSEKEGGPEPALTKKKTTNFFTRKGGWKRLMILFGILICVIVALVVGVTVTQLNKPKKNNTDSSSNNDAANGATTAGVGVVGAPATATAAGSSPTSTEVPSNFPVGTYSFITFLDTIGTDCTSNPSTWTCFPYTIYNTSPTKALTTFNWVISAASTPKNTYTISSITNPFAINFSDAPLKLIGAGTDNERYQFQVTMDKRVVPSAPITDDNVATTCFFNATTFTAYLYTKRAKDYPTAAEGTQNATYQAWPFASRVEETVAGGANVPNCYDTVDGNLGTRVGNFTSEDRTTLCSCLYRSYLTPET